MRWPSRASTRPAGTSRIRRTSRPACGGWPRTTATRLREQRTLDTAVGLVDRSHRGVIAVPGEDRASWLHTLTSQHLTALSAGEGTELLVLSPHGHVEQHAMVAEDGETAWLDTEPGATAGPADVPGEDAVLQQGRTARRHRRTGAAVAGRAGGHGGARHARRDRAGRTGRGRGARSEVRARCRATPGASVRYDVQPLPIGGWARRVPLGVDLLVPRSAMDQVVAELRGAGVPVAGLLGVRGDPGGRPAAPGRGGHRPPDHPGRGRI